MENQVVQWRQNLKGGRIWNLNCQLIIEKMLSRTERDFQPTNQTHNQVQGVPLTYTISIVFSVVECPPTANLSRPRFINVSRFFGLNIVSNYAKMQSSIERDFQSIHRKKSKIAKWRTTNPLPTTLQPNAKLSIDLEILQD